MNKDQEIQDLKDKIDFLTYVNAESVRDLTVEKVIHLTHREGTGTKKDPVKDVHYLWTSNGNFIAKLTSFPS
jgi:hypothetical protein